MYCNIETLKLALDKGFTYCTCSNGGYPDCICESKGYGNVRLDDVITWLREKHEIIVSNGVWEYENGFLYNALILEKEMDDDHKHICPMDYTSWYESLEVGFIYALKLIK